MTDKTREEFEKWLRQDKDRAITCDYAEGAKEIAFSAWQAATEKAIPDGYILIPIIPSQHHLDSIAMRYRNDFFMLDDNQRDGALAIARQMYEECSGQGFYNIPEPPSDN